MVYVMLEYIDVIMIWIFSYEKVEELVYYVEILIINGLIDLYYLC